MTQPFIGIDFGTCNSSAAWFNPRTGQAEPLRNAEGDDKTPSVVYFGPKNETVVGRHAEERLENREGRKRVLSAVKRDLAKQTARVVGDRRVTPLEAAALILAKIKKDAEEHHFHDPVTRAVFTYPAVFTEVEKDKLREAAEAAGFREVELLEEPVAAALAYAEAGIKVGRYVLVYDLGGGTFDLALLAREEEDDTFRVALEPRGERIGGEDFDRAIYDYFDAEARKKTEQPLCPDGLDLHLLRQCRRLKESLSASEQPAPLTWYWPGKGQLTLSLNRRRFEALVEKHVVRTLRLTQAIRQDAAREGYELESVILIGGASRTPCIITSLQEALHIEPRKWEKQDVAVALGAAYHAQRRWGTKPSLSEPVQKKSVRPQINISEPEDYEVLEVDEKPARKQPIANNIVSKQDLTRQRRDEDKEERKPCPMCREMILANAVKCRFCGEIFDESLPRAPGRKKGKKGGKKGGRAYDDDARPRRQLPTYLVQSILLTLFCCWPLGIVAIVNAARVNSRLLSGDIAGAKAASRAAKTWCWWSFGVGLAVQLIVMVIQVAALILSH
jgi:molecular chaperone DnaK (HSP70)